MHGHGIKGTAAGEHGTDIENGQTLVSWRWIDNNSDRQFRIQMHVPLRKCDDNSSLSEALVNLPAKFRGYFPPTMIFAEETACRQLECAVTEILENDKWLRLSEHSRVIRSDFT